MMGAGKTAIGNQLARRLQMRFVDTDAEIESRTGVEVSLIFEIEGDAGFRRREAALIAALAQDSGLVVATGGGAILDANNRAQLRDNGVVVYLSANPELLLERLRLDKKRPLLQVADRHQHLQDMHTLRDPLYRQVADIVIEGGSGSMQHLVAALERELRRWCPSLSSDAP